MALTNELVDWHQEQRCQKAVEALGQTALPPYTVAAGKKHTITL